MRFTSPHMGAMVKLRRQDEKKTVVCVARFRNGIWKPASQEEADAMLRDTASMRTLQIVCEDATPPPGLPVPAVSVEPVASADQPGPADDGIDDADRAEAVRRVREDQEDIAEVADDYDVSAATIKRWMKRF